MRVLAFDTAMAACSVVLWQDGETEASYCDPMMRGQAEALMPAIERVLEQAGQSYETIDRIAVTVGPGSFTGVRVGLATARGLAAAMGCPVIGKRTSDVLATEALNRDDSQPVAVAIDARRSELYLHCFDETGASLDEPVCVLPEDAVASLQGRLWQLAGDAVEPLAAALDVDPSMTGPRIPNGAVLATLAAAAPVPRHPPSPVYVRPPDAAKPNAEGRLRV